jgi:hypothetical protein
MRKPFAEFFRERLGAVHRGSARLLRPAMPQGRPLRRFRLGAQMPIEARNQFSGIIRCAAHAMRGLRSVLEIDGSGEIRVRRA